MPIVPKMVRRLTGFLRGAFVAVTAGGRRASAGAAGGARAAASRGGKTGYVSEFTAFMDQYLAEHPEEVEEQRRGWSIFWNRRVDFDELKQAAEDSVPTDGYYYGPPIPHKPPPSPSEKGKGG